MSGIYTFAISSPPTFLCPREVVHELAESFTMLYQYLRLGTIHCHRHDGESKIIAVDRVGSLK